MPRRVRDLARCLGQRSALKASAGRLTPRTIRGAVAGTMRPSLRARHITIGHRALCALCYRLHMNTEESASALLATMEPELRRVGFAFVAATTMRAELEPLARSTTGRTLRRAGTIWPSIPTWPIRALPAPASWRLCGERRRHPA